MAENSNSLKPWQRVLHEIIFEADTPAGKAFDVALLIAIVLSVIAVCLESVTSFREQYGTLLLIMEWGFTFLFTIEYILRLVSVSRPLRYSVSFFGIVDLLAILPTLASGTRFREITGELPHLCRQQLLQTPIKETRTHDQRPI